MSQNYVDQKIDAFLKEIGDHVDSARIFITRPCDDSADATSCYTIGKGNFHAQYGQVREWILMQEASFDEKGRGLDEPIE